jgi:hypothetical protein
MKRISEFTADRMDMKQMAAISGGALCNGSSTSTMMSGGGCVDTSTLTWDDDYYTHPVTGQKVELRYNYQVTECYSICQ